MTSLADETSDAGKAYRALKSTFDQARTMFSDGSAILLADELDIKESEDWNTVRMANLATFCASVLGAGDVNMQEAHERFLLPSLYAHGVPSASLGKVYVSVKTQAFVQDLKEANAGEVDAVQLLSKYFPDDLEEELRERMDSSLQSALQVEEFLAQISTRKESIRNDLADEGRRGREISLNA